MLTITYVGPDGQETIVGCDRLVRERRSDGFMQFTAFDRDSPPNSYIATWCGDTRPARTQNIGAQHTIFVMNKSGSTVATYRFATPDHNDTPAREGLMLGGEEQREGPVSAAAI